MPAQRNLSYIWDVVLCILWRIGLVVSLALCVPVCVYAQGGSISGQVVSPAGYPVAYGLVRICPTTSTGIPCTPLSPNVYADPAETIPVANPYTTDAFGNYSVFVPANLYYTVQVSFTSNQQPYSYNYIVLAPGSGGGGVTSFSAGNLSPLFTTAVANPTTTPALSFALSNSGNDTFYGNFSGSTGAPSFWTLAAGSNITITPSGNTVTLASTASGTGCMPTGVAGLFQLGSGTGACISADADQDATVPLAFSFGLSETTKSTGPYSASCNGTTCTITATNSFSTGQYVTLPGGGSGITCLSGVVAAITSATGSAFTISESATPCTGSQSGTIGGFYTGASQNFIVNAQGIPYTIPSCTYTSYGCLGNVIINTAFPGAYNPAASAGQFTVNGNKVVLNATAAYSGAGNPQIGSIRLLADAEDAIIIDGTGGTFEGQTGGAVEISGGSVDLEAYQAGVNVASFIVDQVQVTGPGFSVDTGGTGASGIGISDTSSTGIAIDEASSGPLSLGANNLNLNTLVTNVNATSGVAQVFNFTEGTAPTGTAGHDKLWADSTNHELCANYNNTGTVCLAGTPAFTGTSGYQKLAGGLILEWGLASAGTNSSTVTYPLAFPHAFFNLTFANSNAGPDGTRNVCYVSVAPTTSGFTVMTDGSTTNCYWMAVGY